jgi:DNA-binding protein
MSLSRIRNLFNVHMQALPGSIRIAWENVPFEPKPNEVHYRVNFLPAQTRPAANHRSAMDFENGIYQVDIYVPQSQGTANAGSLAEIIRNHFYRGLKLEDISGISAQIQSTPSIVMASREGAYWRTQIDVPWFAYVPGTTPS